MKIETGIDLPPANTFQRQRKYPFRDMNVGDSILFTPEPLGVESKPAKAARVFAYRNGFKFAARTVDGGVRIWRIK